MTKKLKILAALNIILVFATFTTIALVYNPVNILKNTNLNNSAEFMLIDSANVDKIVIGKNVLKRQFGTTWTMNDKITADPFMVEQLLLMLQKIAIKRSLTDKSQTEITTKIAQQGIDIQYFAGNILQKSFRVLGSENETFAQFANAEPYSIHTPAYKAVLHEIFSLPETAWRNRTLISTGWNSLQLLELNYLQKPEQSFAIVFDSLLYKETNQIFYKLNGVNKLDSVMLFNYIKAYNNVRVLKYLENGNLKDSLQKLPPYCTLKIADLNTKQNMMLYLYPTANKIFGIIEKITTKTQKELVLFDMRYISGLLVRRKDFEK